MTKFIGISGKKQAGKDTAAKMISDLLRENGKTCHITYFAEPLKEMCISILGLDRNLVYGSNEDKNKLTHIKWDTFPHDVRLKYTHKELIRRDYMTIREVLQVLGTDIMREMFDYNIWAKAPFNRKWDEDVVILADVRFENEKHFTEVNGGFIIRLERNTGLNDSHISETALDNMEFQYKFRNDGTFQELEDFLKRVLKMEGLI